MNRQQNHIITVLALAKAQAVQFTSRIWKSVRIVLLTTIASTYEMTCSRMCTRKFILSNSIREWECWQVIYLKTAWILQVLLKATTFF